MPAARLATPLLCCAAWSLLLSAGWAAGHSPLPGYADEETFGEEIARLARSELVQARSLAKTREGRDVWMLTVSAGAADERPAILVVGSVSAPHLAGSELSLRLVRELVDRAATDERVAAVLRETTFYVIPRPTPDATARCFARPLWERTGNARPTDDDRDGDLDEDPAEDLNGDGLITQLRVEDAAGRHMPHPDDPRVLIEADPKKKNERGRWTLYSEGIDNDGDELLNEDGPGGVDFNRNLTFRYPFFKAGAGPHQVSEAETRAVVDFAFARPNIAAVFTFAPQDNLLHPWKADGKGGKYRTSIEGADAPFMNYLAERYRKLHGGKDAPAAGDLAGAFVPWAHFHYGRWSLGARGWWIPKVSDAELAAARAARPPEPPADEVAPGDNGAARGAPGAPGAPGAKRGPAKEVDKKNKGKQKEGKEKAKPSGEKRGADQVAALRWLEVAGVDGFVDWTPIEHPDFPGRRVEVGGFRPLVRLNPPAWELPRLARLHADYLLELTELLPRLQLEPPRAESLGGGVWRITATVTNGGYLPTESKMGRASRRVYPAQLALELPESVKLVSGHPRSELPPLARGAQHQQRWVVLSGGAEKIDVTLRTWSPTAGEAETVLRLE